MTGTSVGMQDAGDGRGDRGRWIEVGLGPGQLVGDQPISVCHQPARPAAGVAPAGGAHQIGHQIEPVLRGGKELLCDHRVGGRLGE